MKFLILCLFAVSTSTAEISITPRIIGGVPTTTTAYPHHVSISVINNNGSNHSCSGSLLSLSVVLTSSDCIKNSQEITVSAGRANRNITLGSISVTWNPSESDVIIHPSISENIAILNLPVVLKSSPTIQTIRLADWKLASPGVAAYVPGYDLSSGNLSTATVIVSPDSTCIPYFGNNYDPSLQLCAKPYGLTSPRPCAEDSGAGLVQTWRGQKLLVGLFTGPAQNCYANRPFIFTDTVKYIDWIKWVSKLTYITGGILN